MTILGGWIRINTCYYHQGHPDSDLTRVNCLNLTQFIPTAILTFANSTQPSVWGENTILIQIAVYWNSFLFVLVLWIWNSANLSECPLSNHANGPRKSKQLSKACLAVVFGLKCIYERIVSPQLPEIMTAKVINDIIKDYLMKNPDMRGRHRTSIYEISERFWMRFSSRHTFEHKKRRWPHGVGPTRGAHADKLNWKNPPRSENIKMSTLPIKFWTKLKRWYFDTICRISSSVSCQNLRLFDRHFVLESFVFLNRPFQRGEFFQFIFPYGCLYIIINYTNYLLPKTLVNQKCWFKISNLFKSSTFRLWPQFDFFVIRLIVTI